MKLTDHEKELAARALEKMRERMIGAQRINDPNLSPEDRALMEKYPRHTLEAARYIDACDCGETSVGTGAEDAFWKLRMQETHQPR
jgi:hypothetical protein